jgi:hypothetical protein
MGGIFLLDWQAHDVAAYVKQIEREASRFSPEGRMNPETETQE